MRRRAPHPDQLGFAFEPPTPASRDADLAGLDSVVAGVVAAALKDDPRSRGEIAGAMSTLLAEEFSAYMLDAYASPARGQHNISAGRMLALIAVTERFDLLDSLMRRIGAALLVGEEIHAARLGHLESKMAALKAQLRVARERARPIVRGETMQ